MHEKYLALARDAGSAGDRIAAENYLQHAEHYFRIINTENDGESQGRGRGQQNGAGGRSERPRDGSDGLGATTGAGRPEATDGAAPAVEAETAKPNGADAGAEAGQSEPDGAEAAAPAPKRRATRGNSKGRRTRAASKAGDSEDDTASAGPNGADSGDADTPPNDE